MRHGNHRHSVSLTFGRGFDSRPRQTKGFKTGSSGFPPWRSGLWKYHYDWLAGVKIIDRLSTGVKDSPGNMDLYPVAVE